MKNRYIRRVAESEFGEEGVCYMEIVGGWPTRQVEVYPGRTVWGDMTKPLLLADQPESALDLTEEDDISEGEFELAWAEARRQCPPGS